jgi:hypothetical protein
MTKQEYAKIYYQKNKDKLKVYSENYNREHRKEKIEYQKLYSLTHKEERKIYRKEYNNIHREQINQDNKDRKGEKRIWYNEHKKEIKAYRLKNREKDNEHKRNRFKIDVNFRIKCCLRGRLTKVLKNNIKTEKTITLLGCSIDFARKHIEKQFKLGMTWENWGTGKGDKGMLEWHIDHIRPCCSFDLSQESEQRLCFHYTNLQPLWAKENESKNGEF